MNFFNVLSMLGGLALFLFGMNAMGNGLSKISGSKMEVILEKLTSNKYKGVLLGTGVTAVIQSSSATTVMVVGFVNSGIMKLRQAVGIILGANIGTTVTSWILSLAGVDGNDFWVQMLKPKNFSPIFAIIGIAFILFSKRDKLKDIGTVLVGFAILMFGMEEMSSAVSGLGDSAVFRELFLTFKNPVFGIIAGAVLTAIIQSSSASVGILQALCITGAVSYASAIPIILGQNIGTCVTALISSIGASKNAKRAAFIHLYFNIIGTVVFVIVFYSINAFADFGFMDRAANTVGIAVVHTAFNVVATMVLLPFSNVLIRIAELTVRDNNRSEMAEQKEFKILDPRFLERPGFAVETCKTVMNNMVLSVREAVGKAISLFYNYDESTAKEVVGLESIVDNYEDELGDYLVKLSAKNLSEHDSKTVSKLLHSLGDLERISDHALNLKEAAEEMYNKQISFSDEARAELRVLENAVSEILDSALNSYVGDDKRLALTVEPLEEVIDTINEKLKSRHIKRLRKGQCTIELGFILSDIINNYERISDHCSNIAVCVLQMDSPEFESHEYLGNMKANDIQYKRRYDEYLKEYTLP